MLINLIQTAKCVEVQNTKILKHENWTETHKDVPN